MRKGEEQWVPLTPSDEFAKQNETMVKNSHETLIRGAIKMEEGHFMCIPLHSAPDSGSFGTPHWSVATLVVFTYIIAPSYHVKLSVVCA